MNSRPRHPLARALTPWLAILSLWATVVVPILDAEEWQDGAAIESRHDLSRCVRVHDHSICTQVAASRPLLSDGARYDVAPVRSIRIAPPAARPDDAPRPVTVRSLGSRAPPTV